MHYVITGKDDKSVLFEGGYQNNRPSNMHDKYRFVENIYEELDAPGEWFLDGKAGYLYYYPYSDENIDDAVGGGIQIVEYHLAGADGAYRPSTVRDGGI